MRGIDGQGVAANHPGQRVIAGCQRGSLGPVIRSTDRARQHYSKRLRRDGADLPAGFHRKHIVCQQRALAGREVSSGQRCRDQDVPGRILTRKKALRGIDGQGVAANHPGQRIIARRQRGSLGSVILALDSARQRNGQRLRRDRTDSATHRRRQHIVRQDRASAREEVRWRHRRCYDQPAPDILARKRALRPCDRKAVAANQPRQQVIAGSKRRLQRAVINPADRTRQRATQQLGRDLGSD